MAQEFRTVQYQGADVKATGYVGVPDGQQALESNAQYQSKQLQHVGEALLQQNALKLRNQERVDQIEQENARLSLTQATARNEQSLRNSQMYGEQRLANTKLQEDQLLEIKKLQLTHSIQRDEFDLRSRQQQTEALTQFGEQLVQFSGTLWKAKAEDIKKKNEEMQSYGMMDELLGVGKVTVGDKIRVDQQQYTKLSKQAEAMALAESLEKAGLPNDAARVRASNPWYLHGRQEMAILKGASEMPDYLRNVVKEAEASGALQKGSPDYEMKLRTFVYEGMRHFMMESGISSMNPVLVAKYLQQGFLTSMATITKEFNAANNQFTRQATAAAALGDALNSDHLWASDPTMVNKQVSQMISAAGMEGLKDLLEGTMKRARLTGDDSAVVALMQHPAMQAFQGDYAGFEKTRRAEAQAAMEKETNDRTNSLIAQFQLEAGKLSSGRDLPALRARYEQHMSSLPFEQAARLEKALYEFNPQDAGHASDRLNHVLEYGSASDISTYVRNNPSLSNTQKEQAQKAITARNKVAEDPLIKMAIQQAKNMISGPNNVPPSFAAQARMNPFYKAQIDKIIKQREEALELGAVQYWSQPGATQEGFQKWVQQQQHLINKEITLDELGYQAKAPQASVAIPPNATVNYNGRPVVWMTEPNTQRALINGSYGDVNPQRAVVMTKEQLIAWDAEYGRTGVYPRDLLVLAVRTRTKPGDLLTTQARMHGLRGALSTAPSTSLPDAAPAGPAPAAGQPVTQQFAQQAALSFGLSHRGSIWFANMMKEESGGRPTAVHDSGTGYGLFGHRLDRRTALINYAQTRGIDQSDGPTQIQFALNEIKTQYPDVWRIVSAPNPSTNDLWRAAKMWEGFSERVYAHREKSLRTALGE